MQIETLAKNIQLKLSEQDLSINELEKTSGLKKSAVSNIILGKSKNPSIEVISSIANRLGCTIDELIKDCNQHQRLNSRFPKIADPINTEENKLFIELNYILLDRLSKLKTNIKFDGFTNCLKELFFYATQGRDTRYRDQEFIDWLIKLHFK